tara:strand:+ start:633 stop:1022 length:390 start_codon:yes stop_codon:yes gene_type:complete
MDIKKEWQDKTPTLDQLLINYTPLQIDGEDEILRTYTLGGPDSCRDVRFIADIETLEYLIKVAQKSKTKRAIIPGAGISLKVRRSNQGHIYETLHLVGGTPVPEVPPSSFNVTIPRGNFLRGSPVLKWK